MAAKTEISDPRPGYSDTGFTARKVGTRWSEKRVPEEKNEEMKSEDVGKKFNLKTVSSGRRVTRQQTDAAKKVLVKGQNSNYRLRNTRSTNSTALSELKNTPQNPPLEKAMDSCLKIDDENKFPPNYPDIDEKIVSDGEEDSFVRLIINRSPVKLTLNNKCPDKICEKPKETSKPISGAASTEKNQTLGKISERERKITSPSPRSFRLTMSSRTKLSDPQIATKSRISPKSSGTNIPTKVAHDLRKTANLPSNRSVPNLTNYKTKPPTPSGTGISGTRTLRRVNSQKKDCIIQHQSTKAKGPNKSLKSTNKIKSESRPRQCIRYHETRFQEQKKVEQKQESSLDRLTSQNSFRYSEGVVTECMSNSDNLDTLAVRTVITEKPVSTQILDGTKASTLGSFDLSHTVSSKASKTKIFTRELDSLSQAPASDMKDGTQNTIASCLFTPDFQLENELREREAAALAARAKAAERGRQAVKEWAERQTAKKASMA